MKHLLVVVALVGCESVTPPEPDVPPKIPAVAPPLPPLPPPNPPQSLHDNPLGTPEYRDLERVLKVAFADTALPYSPEVSSDGRNAAICSRTQNWMTHYFRETCYVFSPAGRPVVTNVLDDDGGRAISEHLPAASAAEATVIQRAHEVTAALGAHPHLLTASCSLRANEACQVAGMKWSLGESGTLKVDGRVVRTGHPTDPRGCSVVALDGVIWIDDAATFALVDIEFGTQTDNCATEETRDVRRIPIPKR